MYENIIQRGRAVEEKISDEMCQRNVDSQWVK